MGARRRILKGVGHDVSAFDGDRLTVVLGVRDGKVANIGADGIRTGMTTWIGDEERREVTFKTGAEARAQGRETFAACESARAAALALHKVFIGRDIDEALAIGATEVIAAMDAPPENERCVSAVLRAVRNALVDVQVTVLAETIIEARTLRETG